jgi:hypothetical protein
MWLSSALYSQDPHYHQALPPHFSPPSFKRLTSSYVTEGFGSSSYHSWLENQNLISAHQIEFFLNSFYPQPNDLVIDRKLL